ncbi:hypothetical protein C1646_761136 [Rhizophagus diaphanus]|nr:hypothetical protein C1646_761136 [Rhizophagus diaphanus] [Rhizophagus sp. MUCL 43196]
MNLKSNSPTRNVDPPSNDQFHEESQENQNVNQRQKRYLEFRYIDLNNNNAIYSSAPAILTTYPLEDEDEELQQCLKEIKRRLGNMGTILADSNEAMRCEYISAILHALLYIVKRITIKNLLTLAPQLEVVGKESTG